MYSASARIYCLCHNKMEIRCKAGSAVVSLPVSDPNIGRLQQYWRIFKYWYYKYNKALQNIAILSAQCFRPNIGITTILRGCCIHLCG